MSAFGGAGGPLLATGWSLGMIGLLTIGARLYGASKRAGEIRWDFVYVALAGLFGTTAIILFTISVMSGMGNHIANLNEAQIVFALKWLWMSIFLGLAGLTCAKWAIVAILLQVQLSSQKKRRIFLWSLAIIIGGTSVAHIALILTQCTPVSHLWDFNSPGQCSGASVVLGFSYFQGISGALIDLILALYPITIIWNLQTTLKMKVGFCFLMAGGIIPAACGVAKTTTLRYLSSPTDLTFDFAPFLAWALAELYLLIILGSIPPLRPLFIRIFHKAASTIHTQHTSTDNNTHNGTSKYTSNAGYAQLNAPGAGLRKDSVTSSVVSSPDKLGSGKTSPTPITAGQKKSAPSSAWGKHGLRKSAISMPMRTMGAPTSPTAPSPPPPAAVPAQQRSRGVADRVSAFEQKHTSGTRGVSGLSIYGSSPGGASSVPLRPSVGNTYFGGSTAQTGGAYGSSRMGVNHARQESGRTEMSLLDRYARSSTAGSNVSAAGMGGSSGIVVRSEYEVQSRRKSSMQQLREPRRYF